jgi:hypothetical protein
LGVWDVTSTLVAVDLPMGADMLPAPNKAAVRRAEQEDLNKPLRYQVGLLIMTMMDGPVALYHCLYTVAWRCEVA